MRLKLDDFEYYPDKLVLRMENGYLSQMFGKIVESKNLIDNEDLISNFEGFKVAYEIRHSSPISNLLNFMDEFDHFNWEYVV